MQIITAEQQHSKWSLVRRVISDTLETTVLAIFDACHLTYSNNLEKHTAEQQ
jgi:hypothetical protein